MEQREEELVLLMARGNPKEQERAYAEYCKRKYIPLQRKALVATSFALAAEEAAVAAVDALIAMRNDSFACVRGAPNGARSVWAWLQNRAFWKSKEILKARGRNPGDATLANHDPDCDDPDGSIVGQQHSGSDPEDEVLREELAALTRRYLEDCLGEVGVHFPGDFRFLYEKVVVLGEQLKSMCLDQEIQYHVGIYRVKKFGEFMKRCLTRKFGYVPV